MTWTDTLIARIARHDPGFSARCCGSVESDILRYEERMPVCLPPPHREFLLAFGQNDGGLFEADGFDTSLQAVQAYSRDYLQDYGADFLARFDVFASSPAVEAVAIERIGDGQEPVVFMENDQRHPSWSPLADSLLTLCFGTAFIREMKIRFGRCLLTRGPASSTADLREHLRSAGVVEEPFTDSVSWYGRLEEGTLVAAVRETASPHTSVYLCGASASSLARGLVRDLQLDEPRVSPFA
ncbi:MAG: hypothetical protein SangKO_070160 [Sandaracinaceae bacterium]